MSNLCALELIEQPPLKLLLRHMKDAQLCVSLLLPFIEAVNADNWQLAEELFKDVVRYENDADKKKRDLRQLLRKDLILQLSKSELLRILMEQDKIANFTRDVCGILLWRKTRFPEDMQAVVIEYVNAILETCALAKSCLEVLVTTVDAVFNKDGKDLLDQNLMQLETAESVTDEMQYKLRSLLLAKENNYTAVQMICFYDIVRGMGLIADQAESYGHLLFVSVSD